MRMKLPIRYVEGDAYQEQYCLDAEQNYFTVPDVIAELQAELSARPEAALTIADYRKIGLIKAQCPQCFMELYLPEPKVDTSRPQSGSE